MCIQFEQNMQVRSQWATLLAWVCNGFKDNFMGNKAKLFLALYVCLYKVATKYESQ